MLNHIKKITLSENGFKGLKIDHLVEEQKDGFPFLTPTKSEPKYPIHLGLENKFKELRKHLLNVCQICQNPRDEDEFTYATNDTEVTSIEMASDWFIIGGEFRIGDKKIKLKTYEVEEPDYHEFKQVMDIIKEIKAETREYVAGNRQLSTDELTERIMTNLVRKGKKDDLAELEGMSKEEKMAYCEKYLMDNGVIDIIKQEDVDLPDDTQIIQLNKTA